VDLCLLGSFASPTFCGSPEVVTRLLEEALSTQAATSFPVFIEDIFHHARFFSRYICGPVKAQLLQKVPADTAGYRPSAEQFHIDLHGNDPNKPGIRCLRRYYGAATQWIRPEQESEAILELRQGLRPIEELPKLVAGLPIEEVPDGRAFLYWGGLSEGLIHRAPQCREPRLLLVLSGDPSVTL
jgi:hypothetical protein